MERKKISNYQVVEEFHLDNLHSKVLEKIKLGFVPIGGISSIKKNGLYFYIQAMVKFEE